MLFDKVFNKTSVPLLNKVVAFTEKRHEVLAHNIANQNTPHYRSRDLDVAAFNKQLSRAVEQRSRPGGRTRFEFGNSRNVGSSADGFLVTRSIEDPDPGLLKHNRNNVDAAREQAELARNTIMHNTAVELMRKQFDMLRTAISERVR